MESGELRVIYSNFIVVGPESALAAEGAECASEQGQFFPYHDLLYANQGPENAGFITRDRLTAFGGQLGLDTGAFSECLDSGRYREKVQRDSEKAAELGVRSTPTVFINGRQIENAFDVAQLRTSILSELGRS